MKEPPNRFTGTIPLPHHLTGCEPAVARTKCWFESL